MFTKARHVTIVIRTASSKISLIKTVVLSIMISGFALSQTDDMKSPHLKITEGCEKCHTTGNWGVIHFDHSQTVFGLVYRHATVACRDCHDIRDFTVVTKNCQSCHVDFHQGNLGGNCTECHSERGWFVFDFMEIHKNTTNPVIGKHIAIDCENCHATEKISDFRRVQSDCIACHQADYNNTKNPVHANFDFSNRCDNCHSLLSWQPANWRDHDSEFFPIFSGEHSGTWDNCQTCHTNPNDYKAFSCLNCHEHRRDKMDDEHNDVQGYVYDSQFCYDCHPRGSKGD